MFSDSKISKGGIIGAIVGMLASLFIHKNNDSNSKKALKTGTMGVLGYLLGCYVEKKIKKM